MKKLLIVLIALTLPLSYGCGNLSPRNKEKNNNQNAHDNEMDKIQNGFKNEMGNLKNQNDILNSKLDKLQQGMANFQSNYENSGVEILSGQGGLFLGVIGVIAVAIITIVAMHYRSEAKKNEKVASLMAEQIVRQNNPVLENEVFLAAMKADNVAERVLGLMKTQQKRYATLR
jgi:hypothetical protein